MNQMPKTAKRPSEDLTAFEKYKELSTAQVKHFVGLQHTRSVWKYVKEGKLPKPRYLAEHKPVWRLGEVLDHTHQLMQQTKPEAMFKGEKDNTRVQADKNSRSRVRRLRERLGL